MAKINIFNLRKTVKLPTQKLKSLVRQILNEEKLDYAEINVIFVDDKTIHKINREFLNHDYPTDVISFDLSDDMSIADKVAEIYISIDRAMEQSEFYKVEFENEIARLVAHGILHLAGYDDKTRKGKLKMRERENHYIKKAGF